MSLISLQYSKPLTPSQRWKSSLVSVKNQNPVPVRFSIAQKWKAGRSLSGKVCFRRHGRKLQKNRIPFCAVLLKFKDIVVTTAPVFSFLHEKPFVSCVTKAGGVFLLPAVTTNNPGNVYYANHGKGLVYERGFSGLPIHMNLVPFYLPFCYVATNPYVKYKYATSSGSKCIKIRAPKREKLTKVKLPSGLFRLFSPTSLVIVGKAKQFWRHKRVVGKAGSPVRKGKKQVVRGIVMNSVDHPHGGKANSVQPERSPWGWVTKFSH